MPIDAGSFCSMKSFYTMKSQSKRIPETVVDGSYSSSDLNSEVELFSQRLFSIHL